MDAEMVSINAGSASIPETDPALALVPGLRG
jgi:hypothetical protein